MSGLVYEDFNGDVVLLENGQQKVIGGDGEAADSSGNLADSTRDGGAPVFTYGGNIYFNGSDNLMVFANNSNFATNTAQDISASNSNAWSAGLDPQDFVASNSSVYFVGLDGNDNKGLWVTNGTASGTHEVAGSPTDNGQMASYNGALYFNGPGGDLESYSVANAGNAQHGFSAVSGSAGLNPQDTISASYSALWGGEGTDLFMNGTDAGGKKDLYVYNGSSLSQVGAAGLNPQDLTAVTTPVSIEGMTFDLSAVYFNGVDPSSGKRGLFEANPGADGLGENPNYVSEVAKPSLGGSAYGLDPQDITQLNGLVYFAGGDNTNATDPHGEGLWVYNPATPGTAPHEIVLASGATLNSANYNLDMNASVLGTLAHPQAQISTSGGELYFSASHGGTNDALFAYNPATNTVSTHVSGTAGQAPFNLTGV
jgi:hypothetical protein